MPENPDGSKWHPTRVRNLSPGEAPLTISAPIVQGAFDHSWRRCDKFIMVLT